MITLKIGNRGTFEVASLRDASERYSSVRDASLEGASTFPNGTLYEDGKRFAYVSYNGKVWKGSGYRPGATPLYSPN